MTQHTPDDIREIGKTHYYGDGCNPPHRCPDGTCKRAYNGVCRVCNVDMPKDPQSMEDMEARFLLAHMYPDRSGFQKFDESGDPTRWKTKWGNVLDFIRSEISLSRIAALEEAIEVVEFEITDCIGDENMLLGIEERTTNQTARRIITKLEELKKTK